MKSLFDPSENKQIVERIEKLKPDMQAQWGKMNVSQMLGHAQQPLRVAYGELKLKHRLIGMLFGKWAKKSLLESEQFKRNLPTDPSFIVRDNRDFEEEKKKLIDLVINFKGPEVLAKDPHPFFGKMTVEEWDTIQWKHLDHHLRQFGA